LKQSENDFAFNWYNVLVYYFTQNKKKSQPNQTTKHTFSFSSQNIIIIIIINEQKPHATKKTEPIQKNFLPKNRNSPQKQT
jgi:hypothetical protein